LGYFIQRPEHHSIHHQLDVHKYNFDITWQGIVFLEHLRKLMILHLNAASQTTMRRKFGIFQDLQMFMTHNNITDYLRLFHSIEEPINLIGMKSRQILLLTLA
jgi:hypothetical protein